MTTHTLSRTETASEVFGILSAFLAGVALIYFTGISQASILHDAAHDQRHSMAFPCH
jgi:cobalt transporter subunit CbtB